MPLPDHRLRYPPTRIDFTQDVGLTGQDHDDYPPPQGQARYDHMRMLMIALLSQQSSYDEPTQYRDGTPWFDLNTLVLKIRKGAEWVSYANAIGLGDVDNSGNYKTLSQWYDETNALLSNVAQESTFSGTCTADGINTIPIPPQLLTFMYPDTRIFVYVNGLLLDPRRCSIAGTNIIIAGILIDKDDEYTAILRRVPNSSFYTDSINIP